MANPLSALPCLCSVLSYPNGFLFEWWVVFWSLYNTRSNLTYTKAAAMYLEVTDDAANYVKPS